MLCNRLSWILCCYSSTGVSSRNLERLYMKAYVLRFLCYIINILFCCFFKMSTLNLFCNLFLTCTDNKGWILGLDYKYWVDLFENLLIFIEGIALKYIVIGRFTKPIRYTMRQLITRLHFGILLPTDHDDSGEIRVHISLCL